MTPQIGQASPPAPVMDLDQCINAISDQSGSQSGDVHLAMVALASMLAEEMNTLKDNGSLVGFTVSKLPAIKAVVTNPQLFQALLSMLSGNAQHTDGEAMQGRKRSPSEDNTLSARKKQMLATPPANRPQIYTARQTSQSQLAGPNTGISDSAGNYQIFAATVLYTALQHMDHWPVQLMSKYAEDSFGSRIWVDHELCRDLVGILELSLKPSAVYETDEAASLIADEVENYFSSLSSQVQKIGGANQSLPCRIAVSSQQRTSSAKELRAQSNRAESMDDSSSSGEEEILECNSMEIDAIVPNNDTLSTDVLQKVFHQSSRSMQSRYVGHNLDLAFEAISDALSSRLGSKSKQNSRLLQSLPQFMCIPRVRCLSSRHLDRWMQSPALAALARHLLAEITKALANTDPPLPDDAEVIDNLLKMKLRSNQFTMHVESITLIARRIPTRAVTKQIFVHCLAGDTSDEDAVMNPNHSDLQMLVSVYAVLDKVLAAESLAAAVVELTFLSGISQSHSKVLRLVATTIGDRFDAFLFTEFMIASEMVMLTSITNANDAAKFIFDCAILTGFSGADPDVRCKMMKLRKAILKWSVTELGGVYYNRIFQEETSHCSDTYDGNGAAKRGPGCAEFNSYLDPSASMRNGPMHKFVVVVQCLLFLSPQLEEFVGRDFDAEESECIALCRRYGDAIDDDMLEIVMGCSSLTHGTAVSLIETLVLGCSKSTNAIPISNQVIWKMYELTVYTPGMQSNAKHTDDLLLPPLSHSGLWWRVTVIALVLCGISEEKTIWEKLPTVTALIKMTTAQKYRFPTSDYDESDKEQVRVDDAKMKEREANIAEALFGPLHSESKETTKPVVQRAPEYRQGLRSSARQREKRDKVLALEQERIAAAKHAEQVKLRRQIKLLTKSIMILEPTQCQRKPPKESIDLILSVNDSFDLAARFRSLRDPDFLLLTIGDGRSAIERAYDWLIQIISQDPGVIHRLQPSSTCFLLLKAYGAGADAKELIALSSPLLTHVKSSLEGRYGVYPSIMALKLLLTDLSDETADRRRCSRKVLQQAIPNDYGLCGWLRQLLDWPNAKIMIPLTVDYLSRAMTYERGKVLAAYILSLHRYTTFCSQHELQCKVQFISTLCQLLSSRPHVCANAIDTNCELEGLILNELTRAFDGAMNETSNGSDKDNIVALDLPTFDHQSTTKNVPIESCLLKAAVVVVSNRQADASDDEYNTSVADEGARMNAKDAFERLLAYILPTNHKASGLATAVYLDDKVAAASIEDWISLARAKACIVAKHAALSAPDRFLPRLLLSCALTKLSFATMLRRINKIGDSSDDMNKAFSELLSPAAIAQWGMVNIGNRRIIKKKLLGRILAYTRSSNENQTCETPDEMEDFRSSPFVLWLMAECTSSKQVSQNDGTNFVELCGFDKDNKQVEHDDHQDFLTFSFTNSNDKLWSHEMACDVLNQVCPYSDLCQSDIISENFIRMCIRNEKYDVLEESLKSKDRVLTRKSTRDDSTAMAMLTLYSSFSDDKCFVRLFLKWIPVILCACEDRCIWPTLFVDLVQKYSLPYNICLSIISCCSIQWPSEKILNGCRWIVELAQKATQEVRTAKLALRFLVLSTEHNFHFESGDAGCLLDLSLKCIQPENQDSGGRHFQQSNPALERHVFPDWMAFIVFIADRSPTFLNLAISRMLECITAKSWCSQACQAVILRLYTLHPSTARLSDTRLKSSLLQSSRDNSAAWLHYKCPLDKQIKAMVSNLVRSPHKNMLQDTIQVSCQHPLLLMRHLNTIKRGLELDGSGHDISGQPLMKRGRIQSRPQELAAVVEGRPVKVSVVHWGYSFNEPVWIGVLDLLFSIPAEVLFKVGVELGLLEIMSLYSKLFDAHINDLSAENNIIQLRGKFDRLSLSFINCNPEQYQQIAMKK